MAWHRQNLHTKTVRQLILDMKDAGMIWEHIAKVTGLSTTQCVNIYYQDKNDILRKCIDAGDTVEECCRITGLPLDCVAPIMYWIIERKNGNIGLNIDNMKKRPYIGMLMRTVLEEV